MGGLEQLVTTGSPIGDYKTQHRVRMGYLGDLSDRCRSRRLHRADEADGRPDPVRRTEARRIAHDLGRDDPQR
jgi:hypothetical protein